MTAVLTNTPRKGVVQATWVSLAKGEDGDSASLVGQADKTVTVAGTFDSATVTIQGSNDGTNWFPLTNQKGDPIQFTAGGISIIVENPKFIRPSVDSAGAGTTAVSVSVIGS